MSGGATLYSISFFADASGSGVVNKSKLLFLHSFIGIKY